MKAEYFGKLENGKDVTRYTLSNERISFSVLDKGATMQSFVIDGREILVGSDNIVPYEKARGFMGQVIGPYANRISGASFMLDGIKYVLDRNNGDNTLHSGSANWGAKVWTLSDSSRASVEFLCNTSAGEGGFPGNLVIKVRYTIDGTSIILDYIAETDSLSVINPTNHVYFNLHGNADNILDHEVMICAPSYVAVDSALIPEGVKPVCNTDYDFTDFHKIGERRDGKYDLCYVFGGEKTAQIKADGLCLEVSTDRPGMQLYTGEYLRVLETRWGDLDKGFQGLALETSALPDSVNHPSFPSTVLKRGERFISRTIYTVYTE